MKQFNFLLKLRKKIKSIIPRLFFKIRRLYKKIIYYYYRGNKFYCPICGYQYKKFLSYGHTSQRNVRCPLDDSLERHRLLWIYLVKFSNFFTEKLKVLHFAPIEYFQYIFKNMSNLDYISADLNSPETMIRMDIKNITYPNDSFDKVICFHILEHVDDDHNALKEIFRILKKEGEALILCPIDDNRAITFEDSSIKKPKHREKVFGQKDHVRIYGRDFKDRLIKAGFQIKKEFYPDLLKESIIKKLKLRRNERLFICSKQN